MSDQPPTKVTPSNAPQSAFTLLEAIVGVVVVLIIGVLVVGLRPAHSIGIKGSATKALENSKQIVLGLRLYASDHDGAYPSTLLENGLPGTTSVSDSNTAFAQLFPTYVQSESLFWLSKSAFCSTNRPDENMDNPLLDNPLLDKPVQTLKAGENEWAYVLGLNEKSNPALPLVASGFENPVSHTYTTNPKQRGGVWKGLNAVVIYSDNHGAFEKVNPATMTVTGTNGKGTTGDIFTAAHKSLGWLAPENVVVNPK